MTIEKILLVEDSKTETMIITKILEDAGYTVKNATTADQAMERLRSYKPDVILMDVVMPGQSGFQFTRTLGRDPEYASIPIIICSSKNLETDKVWGLRQGAKDYVTKPVDAGALLAAIRRVGVA
jgi:twitching motility two-component system response regulator PilH